MLLATDASGATLDLCDSVGSTPLVQASALGLEGAVRALLARGARQELQDEARGWTAMHAAAVGGHAGTVAVLCAAPGAGAALAVRDAGGRTPLECAAGGHAAAEAALRAGGAE